MKKYWILGFVIGTILSIVLVFVVYFLTTTELERNCDTKSMDFTNNRYIFDKVIAISPPYFHTRRLIGELTLVNKNGDEGLPLFLLTINGKNFLLKNHKIVYKDTWEFSTDRDSFFEEEGYNYTGKIKYNYAYIVYNTSINKGVLHCHDNRTEWRIYFENDAGNYGQQEYTNISILYLLS